MSDNQTKSWMCSECGLIFHGDRAPAKCPDCGASRDSFMLDQDKSISINQPNITRFVIIGSGIAGISAAETIRKHDPQASIQVITSEHELPYYRMNLTRYLAGELDAGKLSLHPQAWYAQNRIDLKLDRTVSQLLPAEKAILLLDGTRVPYDILILAVGAHPYVPPLKGVELKNVLTIRTIEDVDQLLAGCCEPIDVVCIGGGLLGLEIAGAIQRRGARVKVIESLPWLLPRQLDQVGGRILEKKINALGINVLTAAKTSALLGDGTVNAVQLEDGRVLSADLVVISTGVSANLELARQAGLAVNRGIIVDDHLMTSQPDIYAAGDDTEHHGRMYGLWVPAKTQGTIAGLTATGQETVFEDFAPSAKLKVLGIDLFSIGQISTQDPGDVVISTVENGNYASLVFHQGVLIGAILLGDAHLAAAVKTAIDEKLSFGDRVRTGMSLAEVEQLLK